MAHRRCHAPNPETSEKTVRKPRKLSSFLLLHFMLMEILGRIRLELTIDISHSVLLRLLKFRLRTAWSVKLDVRIELKDAIAAPLDGVDFKSVALGVCLDDRVGVRKLLKVDPLLGVEELDCDVKGF